MATRFVLKIPHGSNQKGKEKEYRKKDNFKNILTSHRPLLIPDIDVITPSLLLLIEKL